MSKAEEQQHEASEFIRDFSMGELDEELSKQMRELANMIRSEAMKRGPDHLVKGQITLKLSFTGESHGGRDVTIDARYEVTTKEPKPVRTGELMFIEKGGKLVKDPPRQTNLYDKFTQGSEAQ